MPPYRKAGLTKSGLLVIATAPYDPDLVAEIKENVPGRRWDSKKKMWYAPASYHGLQYVVSHGYEVGEALTDAYHRLTSNSVKPFSFPLKKVCFDYQKHGVYFLEAKGGKAMLGDDMGLGKTLQVLAWADHHRELRPLLAVVPNTVKLTWKEEVKKWLPRERIYIVSGRPNDLRVNLAKGASIIVINYEMMPNRWKKKTVRKPTMSRIMDVAPTIVKVVLRHNGKVYSFLPEEDGWKKISAALEQLRPETVNVEGYAPGWEEVFTKDLTPRIMAVDECQYIKNPKAQRTAAVMRVGKNVDHVITMSGTPIINRPVEFFTSLLLTNPLLFPDWWHYTGRYCNRKRTRFGLDTSGSSNTKELHEVLSTTIMLRRRKSEVRKDLPDKLISVVPFELSNKAEYREAERNTIAWVRKVFGHKAATRAERAEALSSINYLKQLCGRGKLAEAIAWIADVLDSGHKLIVFCIHLKVVDELMKSFPKVAVRLTGSENIRQKEQAINAFQHGKAQLLVSNIKTGGIGLNLTAASRVAFLELGWTPAEHEQAEDRVVRSGQTADLVNIYYLIAEETIEENILRLIDAKRGNIGEILDGKEAEANTILWDLLAEISEKKVKSGKKK